LLELALGLMREAAALGTAAGAHLAEEDALQVLAFALALPGDAGTSMLYDRLANRPLEYDALTGAVIRHAETHDIDVPLNRAMAALLAGLAPAVRGE
jgi:2-dehydropantoate 2-reductase